MTVRVVCYAGHKGDERPLRFELGERWLAVEEVMDQWFEPDALYFKVRADDESIYILKHFEPNDTWTLESFRRPVA